MRISSKDIEKRRDEIKENIIRVLYNRGDNIGVQWEDDESCLDKLRELAKCESHIEFSNQEIGIESSGLYFFVSIGDSKDVNIALESLEKVMETSLNQKDYLDELKKNKRVAVIVISKNIETSVAVRQAFDLYKFSNVKKKHGKIKIELVDMIVASKQNKIYEITGVDRYCIIQEPKLSTQTYECSSNTIGYVMSVPLLELVKIYNQIGDALFEKNVRYGLGEQLGVNAAIKHTLEVEPEMFWYKNNGITLLVKSDKFSMSLPDRIHFEKGMPFFVINGAQTLTVAAKYYYDLLSKNNNAKEREKGGLIEKINHFDKARILLRIMNIKDDIKANKDLGSEISISLNRQKPIKIEDIAYSSEYITNLVELLENNRENLGKKYFSLLRRGEGDVDGANTMDLVSFAKIHAACIDQPLKARNSSASTLFKIDINGNLIDEQLFPKIENIEDIRSKLGAISFASELEDAFLKEKENILKSEEKGSIKSILMKNTKWYFISYVIKNLNQEKNDFKNFDFSVSDINVRGSMNEYYNYLTSFFKTKDSAEGDGKLEMNLTVFKSNIWYDSIEKNGAGFPELIYNK